jgi:hypothetical protein
MQETSIRVAADNTVRYHVNRFGQFLWGEAVSPYLLQYGNKSRPTADYESGTTYSSKQDRRIDVCWNTCFMPAITSYESGDLPYLNTGIKSDHYQAEIIYINVLVLKHSGSFSLVHSAS